MPEWYELKEPGMVDSPALLIFPERVKENIRTLKSMIDDVNRLRPHVKTNKSPEACSYMMDEGIRKFKAATISEAEMLGSIGAEDVLLAYQPIGPKLNRFIDLVKAFPNTKFSCLIDNKDSAAQMNQFFKTSGFRIPVYLDLNVGMNRTGIPPGQEAIRLYNDCIDAGGIEPVGLHVYDGHIRSIDLNKRREESNECFAPVLKMQEALMEKMLPEPIIIAGGSPTFSIHCKRKRVECSPGTFIYWDKGYLDQCPEQQFLPAAVVITRVVSIPDIHRLCMDLGHKSIASEGDLLKRVHFLNARGLLAIGHSEEHMVLQTATASDFQAGDVLYGLPFHVCPTVALYERGFTVVDGEVTGQWKNIARDRSITV